MSRRALCAMVLGVVLAGCTMMVQESWQPVHISSTPAGAMVSVNGVTQAETTPVTVTLDPRRTNDLRVEKSCYASIPVTLRPEMGLRTFGTYSIPVNQLPPTVHVELTPTCAAGRTS